MCGDSGRCVFCTCVQSDVMCLSCLPLRCGRYSNLSLEIDFPSVGRLTSSHNNNVLNNVADVSNSRSVTTLFNKRFQCAFGALLLHSENDCYDDPWCKLWLRLVTFKNCRYDLPNGSVVEILLLGCLQKLICLLKALFVLRGCWYLFVPCCSETQWFERAQTSVTCLVGVYSIGRNIV